MAKTKPGKQQIGTTPKYWDPSKRKKLIIDKPVKVKKVTFEDDCKDTAPGREEADSNKAQTLQSVCERVQKLYTLKKMSRLYQNLVKVKQPNRSTCPEKAITNISSRLLQLANTDPKFRHLRLYVHQHHAKLTTEIERIRSSSVDLTGVFFLDTVKPGIQATKNNTRADLLLLKPLG
jgi:hypothetical protein